MITVSRLSRTSIRPLLSHQHVRQRRLTVALLQAWVLIHGTQPWNSALLSNDGSGQACELVGLNQAEGNDLFSMISGMMINFMCQL